MTEAVVAEERGRPGDALRASSVSRAFAGVHAPDDVTLEFIQPARRP